MFAQSERAGFALAGISASANPIVCLLLRDASEKTSAKIVSPTGDSVFGGPAFWLVAFIFVSVSLAVFGTVIRLVPILTDSGFYPEKAGRTTALIGGALDDRAPSSIVTGGRPPSDRGFWTCRARFWRRRARSAP